MRNSIKLLPVFLLGSALGGCSMAGTGDYFADHHGQNVYTGQSGHFDQASCWQPEVLSQPQAIAQPAQNNCGQGNFIQPNFVPNFGQANVVQPNFAQPNFVQPNFAQVPVAQPTFVQPNFVQPGFAQGGYVPPTFGATQHGLRGVSKVSNSYAYGTLGGIAYDVGEDIYGIQGRLGYQFNRFLGAEVEGSFGVIDDTDDFVLGGMPFDQEIGIDTSIAGFGVIRYPLIGRLSGLSRVGYHSTEVDVELTDATGAEAETSFNTDGIAYGTGLEYALNPKTSVRVDYTIYDFDGPDAESLSLAVSRKF